MNYQLLPDMTDEQYASLKSDIADRGVMIPLEYDEKGNLFDGHHKLRACIELGITDFPKIVRHFATEEEKRYHVRAVNANRRQLTQEQRRQIIIAQLKDAPQKSDRRIAAELGVSDKTVGVQRKELESIAEIPQCDRQTSDGRVYPAQRKEMESNGDVETVSTSIDTLGREQPCQSERKNPPAVQTPPEPNIDPLDLPAVRRDAIEDYDEYVTANQTTFEDYEEDEDENTTKPIILDWQGNRQQTEQEYYKFLNLSHEVYKEFLGLTRKIRNFDTSSERMDALRDVFYNRDNIAKIPVKDNIQFIDESINVLNKIRAEILKGANKNEKQRI